MPTVAELVSQFESYSDKELYTAFIALDDYSDEGQQALSQAVASRGGIALITDRLKADVAKQKEEARIREEIGGFKKTEIDPAFFKTTLSSTILSEEELHAIIDDETAKVRKEKSDEGVKPRTWIGSLIGGGISSLVGGVAFGYQLVYSGGSTRIMFPLALFALSYILIWIFTKQTYRNWVVLFATIASTCVAFAIAQFIYHNAGAV